MTCKRPWISRDLCGTILALCLLQRVAPSDVEYRWVYANPRFVHSGGFLPNHKKDALDYTHMGMLAVLPNAQLVAAWQGAPVFWEGSRFQAIYLARSPDFGQTWHKEELIVPPKAGVPIWAPVLHVQGNKTHLFYSESRPQCWWVGEGGMHWACGGDLKMIVSADNAHTWSQPKEIMSFDLEGGIAKMVANKVAVAKDGRWLLPFWREMGGHDCMHAPSQHGKAGVLISSDKGISWTSVEVELEAGSPATWLIEATIAGFVSSNDSTSADAFLQLFRTQTGKIYQSASTDGTAWSKAQPTSLPNPNSKVDSLALPDGRIVLAFNDDPAKRTNLALAVSSDGGSTWSRSVILETDVEGSFSYPTLQYLPDKDQVLVIYSVAFPPNRRPGKSGSLPPQGIQKRLGSFVRKAIWLWDYAVRSPWSRTVLRALSIDTGANAWGADAYGLRLAVVEASKLGHSRLDLKCEAASET